MNCNNLGNLRDALSELADGLSNQPKVMTFAKTIDEMQKVHQYQSVFTGPAPPDHIGTKLSEKLETHGGVLKSLSAASTGGGAVTSDTLFGFA